MIKQEVFLKWLIEKEGVSVHEMFKEFGNTAALFVILGFYERWRRSRECEDARRIYTERYEIMMEDPKMTEEEARKMALQEALKQDE